tara:strand:- start:119 stop:1159 length:1041 start_codon:yes stop_codon:yes gene_type:complete
MKICIYAICMNEEDNAENFWESAKDADHVVVLDMGSIDNSVPTLRTLGAKVVETGHYSGSMRFDGARNECLKLVPDDCDLCVVLDLDETLSLGWREQLEYDYSKGVTGMYLWIHEKGKPPVKQMRVHTREGYKWRFPVCEELYSDVPKNEFTSLLTITHSPNAEKKYPRKEMLKLAVKESPTSDKLALALALEYFNDEDYLAAAMWLETLLSHANVKPVLRSYASVLNARIEYRLDGVMNWERWCYKAVAECPQWRDAWYELSMMLTRTDQHHAAYQAASMAVSLVTMQHESFTNLDAWSGKVYMMAAKAAEKLGLRGGAEGFYIRGCRVFPHDKKLAEEYGKFLS